MQLPGYAHHYDDMAQAAEDYKVFLQDGNTNGWEGHEQDATDIDPTYEQQRNGGYEIMDAEDVQNALANPDYDSGWKNISDFIAAFPAETRDAAQLAEKLRTSDAWDRETLKDLCALAGMSAEWEESDGETFEAVAYLATKTPELRCVGRVYSVLSGPAYRSPSPSHGVPTGSF